MALRIAIAAWLALYIPVYSRAYGGWHFLQLCDLSVLLACLGALLGSRLLLSAQALGAPAIALLWLADLAWFAATGHYLHGGTAYLWDGTVPAAARLLSLFHLVLPLLLVMYLRRHGYDRRALPLQAAVSALAIAVSLLGLHGFGNLNYVNAWPGGGAVLPKLPGAHAFAGWLVLCVAIYFPTHLLWQQLFGENSRRAVKLRAAPHPLR